MTQWHYARGAERFGPLTTEQMRALASSGELRREDLVWQDGMTAWSPAGAQPALFENAAPLASVSYYVPTGSMPGRAVENMRGHASPTGDTGDWPLDDVRVAAFRETMKLRRKVNGAAQLYKTLFALSLIAAVVFLLIALFSMSRGGTPRGAMATTPMMVSVAILGGLTLLYALAWRATAKSQRWAPITMLTLFLTAIAINLLGIMINTSSSVPGVAEAAIVTGLIGMLLPILFAVVSWQAVVAIPKYRNQPAWCQELIAASKL